MRVDDVPYRSTVRKQHSGGARSALRWTGLTVAPWILASGLLVSFTAVASNDPLAGFGRAGLYGATKALEGALVPGSAAARLGFADLLAHSAMQFDGDGVQPTGTALRHVAKVEVGEEPVIVRARKSNRLAQPSSLSRTGADMGQQARGADRLVFVSSRALLPPTVLMTGAIATPDWDAARALEPLAGDDPTLTRLTSSVQSPAAAAAGSTGPGRGPSGRTPDGTTPAVPRAATLSSMTPAPAEGVPKAVAAAPVSQPGAGSTFATRGDMPERPRYADMIAPASLEREQRCLAEAVYFEARSEPEEGRAAVAQVVLNRVRSGLYPTSICGVVYQNRNRHLACQFTFACEGKALRITEQESWDSAQRIAADVLGGRTYLAEVGASTHYHADYVRPSWARKLKKMDVIGRHIFYELRPGQT